jgi:hypothetical protein
MPEYLSPGVYIEEIDSGPKPIEGVSTSTAAFIGFTEKVPYVNKLVNRKYVQVAELNQPKLVTSWPQYVRSFADLLKVLICHTLFLDFSKMVGNVVM